MTTSRMELTIPADCIDEYGHVNYKLLPGLYEKGQDALMEECGLSFRSLETDYGFRSFVRRMEIDYPHPLLEGDRIIMVTSLEIGNTSMVYSQSIEKDGEVASSAKLVVVAVDVEGQKTPIPEAVRKKLLGAL